MIGDNHQHCGWVAGKRRIRQSRYHAIDHFQRLIGFRAEWTVLVLRFIERTQMDGHERRLLLAQNLHGIAGLDLISTDAGVVPHHVRTQGRLQLLEQCVGTRKCRDQVPIRRVQGA